MKLETKARLYRKLKLKMQNPKINFFNVKNLKKININAYLK